MPEYVTSRDAAGLLEIPEPRVRQLIHEGRLRGFRTDGYWILPSQQLAQQRATGLAESVLVLQAAYPHWRICELSGGYTALLQVPPARPVLLSGRRVAALRSELEQWHRARSGGP